MTPSHCAAYRRPIAHLISAEPRTMITMDASLMALEVNTVLKY
jgi:hypothetical protein